MKNVVTFLLLVTEVMASSRLRSPSKTHSVEFAQSDPVSLTVNINDSVNFKCPQDGKLKVFMVSSLTHYQNCDVNEDDKLILECTNSLDDPEDTEFKITTFSPQVDAYLFRPGQSYYFVAHAESHCHTKVVMSVSRRKVPHHRTPPKKIETTTSTTLTKKPTTVEVKVSREVMYSPVRSPLRKSGTPSTHSLSLLSLLLSVAFLFG